MNSKKTIPIAALLTVLIIAVLGMLDRWNPTDNQGITSEFQEASATRETDVALMQRGETHAAEGEVRPAPVKAGATAPDDTTSQEWATIPGTAVPIWPKP